MNDIGSKIRALRKERKLTLDVLAGEKLSKGMLSLIENGKAQPSMESLHYIAERLQVDVATLVQEERIENLNEILLQAEELLVEYGKTFYSPTVKSEFDTLIAPIFSKLQKNTYEEIRLLDITYRFRSSNHLNIVDAEYLELAHLYKGVHAYDRMIYSYNNISWKYFFEHQYGVAMDYLRKAEKAMNEHHWHINNLTRLDMYYNIMAIATALFDYETMETYFEKALKLSSEKRIYFKIDDMYRIKFATNLSEEHFEEARQFLKKIEAMVYFVEDKTTEMLYKVCEVHFINNVERDYERALAIIVELRQMSTQKQTEMEMSMYNNEEVYALYELGRYEEALAIAKDNAVPFYINHPLDLVMYYLNSAIRAHCYALLGYKEDAKRDILYAVESIKTYKPSYYTKKIQAIYAELKALIPNI